MLAIRSYLVQSVIYIQIALVTVLAGCGSSGTAGMDNSDADLISVTTPVTTLHSSSVHGTAPLVVHFTASAANFPAGSTLYYDYDFDCDGAYELQGIGANPPQQVFANPGTYKVRVRVRSSSGYWVTRSVLIQVVPAGVLPPAAVHSCPIASVTAIPSSVAVGGAVTLNGSGSFDPDGLILNYEWDTNGDGVYELSHSTAKPAAVSFATKGTYFVALRVTDADGLTAEGTAKVAVTASGTIDPQDTGPTAWLQAFPSSGAAPLTVSLDASGSWAGNGGALTFDWDTDGDGTFEIIAGAETVTHVYNTAGDFLPVVRVTDTNNVWATKSAAVTVSAGQEQIHAQLYVYPVSGTAPLTVTLDANGSWSIDGAALSYEFDPEGDGTYQPSTSQVLTTYTYTQAGTYTPRMRVTDAKSRTAQTTGSTVTVTGAVSDAPVARIAATPQSGAAPLTVAFDATSSTDPNNDIMNYMFDFQTDGTYDAVNATGKASFTYTVDGTYTATVLVRDVQNHTSTAATQIVISATAGGPTIWLMAFPTSGEAPLSVSLDASGSWAENGLALTYDWDLDGNGVYEILGGGATEDYVYTTAGTYHPGVRVTDSTHAQASKTVTITVTPGQEQIHAQMYAYPTSGTAPLTVTLEASGSWSIDGAAQTYEYDPEGDGIYQASTSQTITTFIYTQAGVYTPRLRVTDTMSRTATTTGPQITVAAPASVAPVAKLQAVPQSGSAPLIVNFDATTSTDANNDIVSYAFDFQTDGTYDTTNATGIATYTYIADGNYTATVLVRDALNHTAVAAVQIAVNSTGGSGPSAIVIATPYSGAVPLTVTYYAGYSYAPDSAVKSFDWDMNNDGVFEKLDAGPEQTATYTTAGTYKIKMRVTDYKGHQAVSDCEIIAG
jgi:large repetitive protein